MKGPILSAVRFGGPTLSPFRDFFVPLGIKTRRFSRIILDVGSTKALCYVQVTLEYFLKVFPTHYYS
ncbi:hypothetical protein SK128_002322 [Halocaridina rubra]|uniref:Uncharacterized protein n=1 Tax=Halocaridina rubra TaxID=373956 RepID=A0AAN8X1V0_HALRR